MVRGRWGGSWYSRFSFNQFSLYPFYRLGYAKKKKKKSSCAVPDLENELTVAGDKDGEKE